MSKEVKPHIRIEQVCAGGRRPSVRVGFRIYRGKKCLSGRIKTFTRALAKLEKLA